MRARSRGVVAAVLVAGSLLAASAPAWAASPPGTRSPSIVRGLVAQSTKARPHGGVTTPTPSGQSGTNAGTPSSGSAQQTYRQQLAAYVTAKNAIEKAFRAQIRAAWKAYQTALAASTNSSQRSAARQAYVTAVIDAAAARTSALEALGPPPTPPSGSHLTI